MSPPAPKSDPSSAEVTIRRLRRLISTRSKLYSSRDTRVMGSRTVTPMEEALKGAKGEAPAPAAASSSRCRRAKISSATRAAGRWPPVLAVALVSPPASKWRREEALSGRR